MLAPAASAGRVVLRQLLDFALPPRCPGCGAITQADHSFCFGCWQSLHFLGDPCCACCGHPFAHESGEGALCGACLAHPPRFDRVRAAVAYGEVARKVALKLKYAGRPGVAETLARFMSRHIEGEREAVLMPVPLHRWRIWKRGYNQSALIARALSRRTGLGTEMDLLKRVKATPPLRGLGRKERAETVRGAFVVPAERKAEAKGRTFVLVDDVFTTGATAGACAKALKRAGAARVEVICWARVTGGED